MDCLNKVATEQSPPTAIWLTGMAYTIVQHQMRPARRLASSVACPADCLCSMTCKGIIKWQNDSCKRAGEGPCSQAREGTSLFSTHCQ